MSGSFLPMGGLKGRSELWLRTVSAIVLGVVAIVSAWLGGWTLAVVWALAGAIAAWEWCGLTIRPSSDARAAGAFAAALAALAGLLAHAGLVSAASGAGAALALVGGFVILRTPQGALRLLTAFIIGAILAVTPVAARHVPGAGMAVLLWMFAVVWTTDIAAFFTGKTFGGPKLWPRVSPGKTWSGFVGGAIFGGLAGVLMLTLGSGWAFSWKLALVSVLASVLGQGGDLAESALKRHAGVKDSGRLIPGHGGVLDRLDGFLAVAALVACGLLVHAL